MTVKEMNDVFKAIFEEDWVGVTGLTLHYSDGKKKEFELYPMSEVFTRLEEKANAKRKEQLHKKSFTLNFYENGAVMGDEGIRKLAAMIRDELQDMESKGL